MDTNTLYGTAGTVKRHTHMITYPRTHGFCVVDTVEVGSLHTLRLESLKLVFQPLHKFLVNNKL